MTKYSTHSALFFLLIFTAYLAAGSALNSYAYYSAASGSSAVILKKQCKNSAHFSHISQKQNKFYTAKELPAADQQPVILTNCNSSLQTMIATNNFILEPSKQNRFIHLKNAFLSSQIFVYQEPDPPRYT